MDRSEIDRLLAAVRSGQDLHVPFTTTLGPDTQAQQSLVRRRPDGGFELSTTFVEHAPGHGWSIAQTEVEPRTEAQIRAALAHCAVDGCQLVP
jgi:hypothetical protein